MKFLAISLAVLAASICQSHASDQVHAPRGVHPDLTAMYLANTKEFTCLDGSGRIPFNLVNDDYCDCKDGSDEPGTSACEVAKFYCANAGHQAKIVQSSRVNDGICDCCDGSDEWAASDPCANSCMEMGAAARDEAARLEQVHREGFEKKKLLIAEGQELKKTRQEELNSHKGELEEAKKIQEEKEEIKKTLEEAEKVLLDKHNAAKEAERQAREEEERKAEEEVGRQFFAEVDTNGDGSLHVTEIMAHAKFDTNNDGVVSDDEANFFLSGNTEYTLEDFMTTGWAIIKPRVLGKEEPAAPEKADIGDLEEDLDDIDDEDDYPDYDKIDDEDGEVGHPGEVEPVVSDEIRAPEVNEPEEEVKEEEVDEYDPETRAAVDKADAARAEYEDARSTVRNLEDTMDHLRKNLVLDFGPNEEFAALKDKCYEFHDNEYTYRLCPFDYCEQKPKHGGGTRLGNWEDYVAVGDNKYAKMKFSGGQTCWNGPARSTTVDLVCGPEEKVVHVSEPAKCEYEMVFETAAVCSEVVPGAGQGHDEL